MSLLPSNLSPALRPIAETEFSLGNAVVRVEEGVWSSCPLAVVFAEPLHFVEVEKAGLISEGIERWESRDPHYSVEAGYIDKASRQTIAGPIG